MFLVWLNFFLKGMGGEGKRAKSLMVNFSSPPILGGLEGRENN